MPCGLAVGGATKESQEYPRSDMASTSSNQIEVLQPFYSRSPAVLRLCAAFPPVPIVYKPLLMFQMYGEIYQRIVDPTDPFSSSSATERLASRGCCSKG